MFPYGVTVTITPQAVDNFGDRTAGAPADVAGCVIYDTPGTETVGGQDTVVYDVTVIAPHGTVVNATDRVTIAGATFEVASEPIDWHSPLTGSTPGVQFTARRIVG